eukprot:TRINITY_DN419_c0_g1_i1.p1 TRINITY_DN419_c0_g1~~TRINITY_DN419_c0_g1_i1.p1  ORF type:complete len:368 (+),score=43.28 TRINITY_DN419_c0_g1_i1:1677-2780(+)
MNRPIFLLTIWGCMLHMFVVSQPVDSFAQLQPVWYANPNPVVAYPVATPSPTPTFVSSNPQPQYQPQPDAGQIFLPLNTFSPPQEGFCASEEQESYNMTRDILTRFCTVVTLTDLRQLNDKDVETCCLVDRSIVENDCYDQCIEDENAFDTAVVLVDLWRAVCRVEKQICQETEAVQKAVTSQNEEPPLAPPTSVPSIVPPPQPTLSPQTQEVTPTTPTESISLSSLINAVPGLTLLADYLQKANLLTALEDPQTIVTFFAPTNVAFQRLSQRTGVPIDNLEQIPGWDQILRYHIIVGVHQVSTLSPVSFTQMTTVQGDAIVMLGPDRVSSCCVQGNTAQILVADTEVANGMFHVVNEILLPFPVEL